MSRKGGTGGGGWVHPKGESSMGMKALGWSQEGNFSCFKSIMDLRDEEKTVLSPCMASNSSINTQGQFSS